MGDTERELEQSPPGAGPDARQGSGELMADEICEDCRHPVAECECVISLVSPPPASRLTAVNVLTPELLGELADTPVCLRCGNEAHARSEACPPPNAERLAQLAGLGYGNFARETSGPPMTLLSMASSPDRTAQSAVDDMLALRLATFDAHVRGDLVQTWERWARAVPPGAPECTGVAAVWCPRCGDCSCPRLPSGERELEADGCPLHGTSSTHGENPELVEAIRARQRRIYTIAVVLGRVWQTDRARAQGPSRTELELIDELARTVRAHDADQKL